MQYITVSREFEPKITGTNQPFSLEFKKNSFINKDDEKLLFSHLDDWDKISIESYQPFDSKVLKGEIALYPVGKRVKKLDFMGVGPNIWGIWTAVSKKVLTIIQKYKLPQYTLIPVNVETYDEPYYLIGFPVIKTKYVDFSKSDFFDTRSRSIVTFADFNEYRENIVSVKAHNILLPIEYDYDVLKVVCCQDICLSEKLANELQENNCTGLIFKSLDNISVSTLD